MRLIDADALLIHSYRVVEYDEAGFSMEHNAVPTEEIKNAPTIEAVPVVRGEWIDTQPGYKNGYYRNAHKCSVCQDYYTTDYEYMNFCPNCGERLVKDNE